MTAWQSSLGALTIEQATPDELNLVMEIIDEAAAWLHARGITGQWSSPMSQAVWDKIGIAHRRRKCFSRAIVRGSSSRHTAF